MPLLKQRHHFFFSIVFPIILTLILFNLTIFALLIPQMKDMIIERKKDMIQELTAVALSELRNFYQQTLMGELSEKEAKHLAQNAIREMRYGKEGKDYFWISDRKSNLVMHPYRPDLEGKNQEEFKDSTGKRPFIEFANIAKEQGKGFISYNWQKKDDVTKIIPKLSFVQEFTPWNWIVGTGVYIEDVQAEVTKLTETLVFISLCISSFLFILLSYIIKQGHNLERSRRNSEIALKHSEEKYRALVESNQDGILLVLQGQLIYANQSFLNMTGYDLQQLRALTLSDLVVKKNHDQVWLRRTAGEPLEVTFGTTSVSLQEQKGEMLSFKIEKKYRKEHAIQLLLQELQSLIPHANARVKEITSPLVGHPDTTLPQISEKAFIFEAQDLMKKHQTDKLLVLDQGQKVVGSIDVQSILFFQKNPLTLLKQKITDCDNEEELKTIYDMLPFFIKGLLVSGANVSLITQLISNLSDTATTKIIEMATRKLGPSPRSFAFIVFGSEARQEQTLFSDQDTGIIYADSSGHNQEEDLVKSYFIDLGKEITEGLKRLGQPPCQGKVSASNPLWCRGLHQWEDYLKKIIHNSDSSQVFHDISIFYDIRCVNGDSSLAQILKEKFLNLTKDNQIFLYNFAATILKSKVPMGFFGIEFTTNEHGKSLIPLKLVILPIVNIIKLYSFKNQIQEESTIGRIEELQKRKVLLTSSAEELKIAFEWVLGLLIKHQLHLKEEDADISPDLVSMIDFDHLNQIEQTLLKKILSDVAILQTKAEMEFLNRR